MELHGSPSCTPKVAVSAFHFNKARQQPADAAAEQPERGCCHEDSHDARDDVEADRAEAASDRHR